MKNIILTLALLCSGYIASSQVFLGGGYSTEIVADLTKNQKPRTEQFNAHLGFKMTPVKNLEIEIVPAQVNMYRNGTTNQFTRSWSANITTRYYFRKKKGIKNG